MEPTTRTGRPAGAAGFTLIEMITVVAIMSVLVAIALPNYKVSIIQSKEAVLREDLYRFRDLIDQYYSDKGRYPESLETLVTDGYLRKLPNDPMTNQPNWELVPAEPDPDNPDEQPGVYDVHSSSDQLSMNGTPYNTW
jgi:general secretion pathway protein G